jgi:hypothetical protein
VVTRSWATAHTHGQNVRALGRGAAREAGYIHAAAHAQSHAPVGLSGGLLPAAGPTERSQVQLLGHLLPSGHGFEGVCKLCDAHSTLHRGRLPPLPNAAVLAQEQKAATACFLLAADDFAQQAWGIYHHQGIYPRLSGKKKVACAQNGQQDGDGVVKASV